MDAYITGNWGATYFTRMTVCIHCDKEDCICAYKSCEECGALSRDEQLTFDGEVYLCKEHAA